MYPGDRLPPALVGFLIAGLFGRRIGARPSEIVTTALLFVSCVLSWIAFVNVGFGTGATRIQVAPWFASGDIVVDWAFASTRSPS